MTPHRSFLVLAFAALVARPALAQTPAPKPAPAKGAATSSPAQAPSPPTSPSAPPAASAAPPSLGESLTGDAKSNYEAGKLLFGVSDFAAALIKFTAAHDASKDPRLLWNMATCEDKLHHYAKAVALVRAYLKEGGSLLSDQDRSDADGTVKAMEPLTSTVRLGVNEPGADVYIDDLLVGQTPVEPQLVDIGVHKVRVHKAEFEEVSQDVTVSGGATVSLDVYLRPIVHEGRVVIHAGARDAIALDGQSVGVELWAGTLKSGGHTLRVTASGMIPYQAEVLVQDGQTRELNVTLNPEPSKGILPTWAWVAGGVVLAGGAGVGAYFLLKPTSKYDGPSGNLGPGLVQASAPGHALIRY